MSGRQDYSVGDQVPQIVHHRYRRRAGKMRWPRSDAIDIIIDGVRLSSPARGIGIGDV